MKAFPLVLLPLLLLWQALPATAQDAGAAGDAAVVVSTDGPDARESGMTADPADIEVVLPNDECGCCSCSECQDPCCSISNLEFHGPLAVSNTHPTTALFLGPVPATAAALADGEEFFRFKLDHTNNIIRELDSGVIVDFDFEALRMTFDYHCGIGGGEFSARLPVISRTHGIFDGVISDWHKWFGLPNGLRNTFPDNQYHYTIVSRQGPVFNDDGDAFGIGDIALEYKRPVFVHDDGSALAWRTALKLPTGDPDHALGSGGVDVQVGGIYEHRFTEHWKGYVNVDYVFIGEPDWDNVGHQDVITTLWAAEYALNGNTTLVGQFRTQRNPLRVGSKEADKDGQEIALGFHHRLGDRLVWSGGFSEDINPETAPDFVILSHFTWDL